jgi:hypothetical protein
VKGGRRAAVGGGKKLRARLFMLILFPRNFISMKFHEMMNCRIIILKAFSCFRPPPAAFRLYK